MESNPPITSQERRRVLGICLALAVLIFAVFGQTLFYDFVNFDDNEYIIDNPMVARGLSPQGIEWAFTHVYSHNWHPLTWISHMLDCQFYGLHPMGHHLSNVLLHAATAVALFLLLRQMTGATWRSAFVAAVFAIHPLRVESVAWIAERKDVLSGLLFILTIAAYVRYVRRPGSLSRYGLVLIFFALGLLSKPMLVTLPVVLLLLDYWPLHRKEPLKNLLLEKSPMAALSAAACVATILAQKTSIDSTAAISIPLRLGNAVVSCMVYLWQMVWPAKLAVYYPFPQNGNPDWEVILASVVLIGFFVVAWQGRKARPWLLIGWLWYLVMLLPVVGIIQVGNQAHADRYTYLPQIGIYIAVTWLLAELRVPRAVFRLAMPAVLATLAVCAWKQTTYWRNSESLWTRTISCTKDNHVAHYNFGVSLIDEGRTNEGISQIEQAAQIHPIYHYNLAQALLQQGKIHDAIAQFEYAAQVDPNSAAVHNSLGCALLREQKTAEAANQFKRSLQIDPSHPQAHYNLANILFQNGRVDDAISEYERALQSDPDYAEAHANLGSAFLQKGNVTDAVPHYERALQIDPKCTPAVVNLCAILIQQGKTEEALTRFEQAIQLQPDNPQLQKLGAELRRRAPRP